MAVTPEIEITEDDRTSAFGLFNYAISYWKSAFEQERLKIPDITHPGAPVDFMYVHAVELFLKSYLRLRKSVQELRDVGHKLEDLKGACSDIFLDCDEKFEETIELISQNKINSFSRYIYTGARICYPQTIRFEELCAFLHDAIREKLIEAGFSVR